MCNRIKHILRFLLKFIIAMLLLLVVSFIIYEIVLAVRIEKIANSDDSLYKNEILSEDMEIHMVDVGQGDGFVVTLKDQVIVIDCGPILHSGAMTKYLKKMGVKKIDVLILSHQHQDHFGGLDQIVSNFKVDKIYITEIETKTNMTPFEVFHYYRCNSTIATFNMINHYSSVESFKTKKGKLKTESVGEMTITFIGPVKSYDDINNNSLVFKLEYKDVSVLFTGDIEKKSELDLVEEYGDDLKVDILKLPHHGSHTSSCEEFLAKTDPQIALISCAIDNDFWHPHKQVAKRLKENGIVLYRTDEDGDIIIVTDGHEIYSKNNEGDYKCGAQLSSK